MKAFSLKIKIALSSALIMLVGFVLVLLVTFNVAKKNISEAMIEQLINENSQIAAQAEILIEKGATVENFKHL